MLTVNEKDSTNRPTQPNAITMDVLKTEFQVVPGGNRLIYRQSDPMTTTFFREIPMSSIAMRSHDAKTLK